MGASTNYYRTHPEARAKKQKTDAKINRRPEQVKRRVESNAKQREAKAAGRNTKNMDYDHAVGKMVKASTNRGRAEKSRLKGSKRG